MSLQSTAMLGSSPLHGNDIDGSSLEEMLCSPALRRLMRLSFRLHLEISFSLCYSLRLALHISMAAWLCFKIASSGRGTFTGTR
jgi:hypothetical protein